MCVRSPIRKVSWLYDQQPRDRGNLDQIQAVLDMKPAHNIKEVQQLTGCVAGLGLFMSRSINNCQPFFCVLQRSANFA